MKHDIADKVAFVNHDSHLVNQAATFNIHGGQHNHFASPEAVESSLDQQSIALPFPPDPHFVKRGTLTDVIHHKLSVLASRVALVGLGGIGKTQLANAYVHSVRRQTPDTWTFWLHASSTARFQQSVQDIVSQLKIPGWKDPQANVLQLLWTRLLDRRKGRWLVVLDNADNVDFLHQTQGTGAEQQRTLMEYLPPSNHGSVLITSRSKDAVRKLVEDEDNIVQVHPMGDATAIRLLEKKLGKAYAEQDADLAALAAALERMPLALTQAAAYIRQSEGRCNVSQYLKKLGHTEKSKASLLNQDHGDLRRDREAKNSIILTWEISFDRIQEIRPTAADLLALMSFFDRQGIPEALLKERGYHRASGATNNPSEVDRKGSLRGNMGRSDRLFSWNESYAKSSVGSGCGSESESNSDSENEDTDTDELFEGDISMLRGFSFVASTTGSSDFTMHGLVQLATKRWLKLHGEDRRWQDQFVVNLNYAFPSGEYETWVVCNSLFPHAKRAAVLKLRGDEMQLEWAELMSRAGRYATEQGQLQFAEELCTLSLRTRKKVLGREHPDTLRSMSNLASTHSDQGRWEEAEKLQVQVLEMSEKLLGKEHPNTLTSMANLAYTFKEQNRHAEVLQLMRNCATISLSKLGLNHPDTLFRRDCVQ